VIKRVIGRLSVPVDNETLLTASGNYFKHFCLWQTLVASVGLTFNRKNFVKK